MITSLLVQAPEGFEDVVENFQSLVYGVVVPILMIVLGAIFVVIGIIRAAHISMADNEDSKKKAVKAMVWFFNRRGSLFRGCVYGARAVQLSKLHLPRSNRLNIQTRKNGAVRYSASHRYTFSLVNLGKLPIEGLTSLQGKRKTRNIVKLLDRPPRL